MADDKDDMQQRQSAQIHWSWRAALGMLGILGLVLSLTLFLHPPLRSTHESIGTTYEKTTSVPADPTSICVALLSAGLLLVFIAANGRKLLSVSKDGAQFDAPPRDQIAKDVAQAKTISQKPSVEEPVTDSTSLKTLLMDDLEYRVFKPEDVPASVIAVVSEQTGGKVKASSDLQYGFRQTGKGNHAWFVKTNTDETWKVAFGGQGKSEASSQKISSGAKPGE